MIKLLDFFIYLFGLLTLIDGAFSLTRLDKEEEREKYMETIEDCQKK